MAKTPINRIVDTKKALEDRLAELEDTVKRAEAHVKKERPKLIADIEEYEKIIEAYNNQYNRKEGEVPF